MDPKLVAMMARRKKIAEGSEDNTWLPDSSADCSAASTPEKVGGENPDDPFDLQAPLVHSRLVQSATAESNYLEEAVQRLGLDESPSGFHDNTTGKRLQCGIVGLGFDDNTGWNADGGITVSSGSSGTPLQRAESALPQLHAAGRYRAASCGSGQASFSSEQRCCACS